MASVQGIIQDLRGHVPLCADPVVLSDVHGVRCRYVSDCEAKIGDGALAVSLDQDIFAL